MTGDFSVLIIPAQMDHEDAGRIVKLLLTSGGVSNESIRNALVEMLGKPISECNALCIPTAEWGHPWCTPGSAWRFATGNGAGPMVGLGWTSVGLLELTALPSIGSDRWHDWVRGADALLVDGGDATYLGHWMRQSGLIDLLQTLPDMVWVGMSAGSMVMTPRIGGDFVSWKPGAGSDTTLGLVDFAIYPHLDNPMLKNNTIGNAEKWAATMDCPAYAIDDETAIAVVGDRVEVVSEGQWKVLRPRH